jgi:hypothetical protein
MPKSGHTETRIIRFAEGSTCTGKPEVILDWREQNNARFQTHPNLDECIGDLSLIEKAAETCGLPAIREQVWFTSSFPQKVKKRVGSCGVQPGMGNRYGVVKLILFVRVAVIAELFPGWSILEIGKY